MVWHTYKRREVSVRGKVSDSSWGPSVTKPLCSHWVHVQTLGDCVAGHARVSLQKYSNSVPIPCIPYQGKDIVPLLVLKRTTLDHEYYQDLRTPVEFTRSILLWAPTNSTLLTLCPCQWSEEGDGNLWGYPGNSITVRMMPRKEKSPAKCNLFKIAILPGNE